MEKYRLTQQHSSTSSVGVLCESEKIEDIKKHVMSRLRSHDRGVELSDAMEALELRGYYLIGWSSEKLMLEKIS